MSERWKHQFKTGIFWGLYMTVVMTLFDMNEKPVMIEITLPRFYAKLAIYLAAGIFGGGYFSWKQKQKGGDYTWSDLFGKKKK